jgi:hypothetical protein
MIIDRELAAWLADPARKLASATTADLTARAWAGHELVQGLRRELEAIEPKTAEAVLAAAERFMNQEEQIAGFVRDLVAKSVADPFFQPAFLTLAGDISTGLVLYADRNVFISLAVAGVDALAAKKSGNRGPSSIAFTGLPTLFHVVKSGGATLSFWEAPRIGADFVGDRTGRCRMTEMRRIEDGERILIDGWTQSFVIEHATSDIILLQAAVHAECAPLALEYDSKTCEFIGASSTDEGSSRIEMMVSLMRAMDHKEAGPLLEELLESPHFFTRWYVMREYLGLDAEAALPSLRRLAGGDPHPHVRAAAQQTLAMFFDQDLAQEEAA